MQDRFAHQVHQFGEAVFAVAFGGVEHGRQRGIGLRAPLRAEAAHHFAMNDRRAQGAFAGVVIRRDIRPLEKHEQMITMGLVTGFGFTQPCAVATTVAHDSHQLIVVGTDEECMAIAANKLKEVHGGQVVVVNGEITGIVELPIAGLMSNESGQTVARKAANVLAGYKECGSLLNNPNMQVSLLGLVVIPELRLSDLGLVDTKNMKFIGLVD